MQFLDPHHALRQFGIYGAQDVGDLGAGAGHFSLAAASRLDGGRLFAVDVEKDMLARLITEAHEGGHKNVHTLWGDLARVSGVPLATEALDRAIAANILYQVHDREAFVQEVRRLLKPGGKVLVIDWRDSHDFGPEKKYKIAEDTAHGLFRKHGFEKERDIEVGDLHYGMIFVRGV